MQNKNNKQQTHSHKHTQSAGNLVEVHSVGEDGLEPIKTIPFYGKIIKSMLFRPLKEKTDHLFVLTDRCCVLQIKIKQNKSCKSTNTTIDFLFVLFAWIQ